MGQRVEAVTRRRLPKWCSEFVDRHGKVRVRFRRKGQETYYFRATAWTPEFMQEYEACKAKKAAPEIEPGAARTKPGTISALIASYYKSPEFLGLRATTRAAWRNVIERFRAEHGEKRVATLERAHVKAIIAAKAATPAAANNLLKRIKALMTFAVDTEMRRDNPTIGLRGFRIESDGLHTWSEAEIEQFEARHAVGTSARLAMALMLYTGQRRSDAVLMGRQHVKAGKITVRQVKTGARLEIPMHPALRAVIAEAPSEHLTFLVTSYGKPFTPAGFGNWFRDRCNEAGLPQCSAHGLRKAAARRLAEAGASNQEIKSVTGHKSDVEVARYTAAADQARLAESAIGRTSAEQQPKKMANLGE
jgi:integrase